MAYQGIKQIENSIQQLQYTGRAELWNLSYNSSVQIDNDWTSEQVGERTVEE